MAVKSRKKAPVNGAKKLLNPPMPRNRLANMSRLGFLENAKLQSDQLILNLMTHRSDLLQREIEGARDIDKECGYPDHPDVQDFKKFAKRFGLARRYVSLLPEESFQVDPSIYESDDPEDETAFEARFNEIEQKHNLIYYMQLVDELSGYGRFGILLLGINDGRELSQPVEGVNSKGERTGSKQHDLIYVRAFDETCVRIAEREKSRKSPRYGWPTMYEITFNTVDGDEVALKDRKVHWTRVVHIADNTESSPVLGTPRLEAVFNTMLDLKKLYGGSAEMFWKGAFPGFAFEIDPDAEEELEIDEESIKEEFWRYSEGLQRSLQIAGVTVKQLSPQVAEPTEHISTALNFLTMTLSCPLRVFMGSEVGKLASEEDKGTWNQRVARRQKRYVIPMIIRRIVDHLILLGVLPEAKYKVSFPDINTPSQQDKATIAKTLIEALAKYVATGAERLIPPKEFFTFVLGFDKEEIDVIMAAAEEYAKVLEKRQEEEMRQQKEMMGAEAMAKGGVGGPRIRGAANPNGGVEKNNRGRLQGAGVKVAKSDPKTSKPVR